MTNQLPVWLPLNKYETKSSLLLHIEVAIVLEHSSTLWQQCAWPAGVVYLGSIFLSRGGWGGWDKFSDISSNMCTTFIPLQSSNVYIYRALISPITRQQGIHFSLHRSEYSEVWTVHDLDAHCLCKVPVPCRSTLVHVWVEELVNISRSLQCVLPVPLH